MILERVLQIGMFNRKSNLARIQKPVGFRVEFTDNTTTFRLDNVADTPALAEKMSLRERMRESLKRGPMTSDDLAGITGGTVKEVNRIAKKFTKLFAVEGNRISNLYRD
jgi:hypothetical protein